MSKQGPGGTQRVSEHPPHGDGRRQVREARFNKGSQCRPHKGCSPSLASIDRRCGGITETQGRNEMGMTILEPGSAAMQCPDSLVDLHQEQKSKFKQGRALPLSGPQADEPHSTLVASCCVNAGEPQISRARGDGANLYFRRRRRRLRIPRDLGDRDDTAAHSAPQWPHKGSGTHPERTGPNSPAGWGGPREAGHALRGLGPDR